MYSMPYVHVYEDLRLHAYQEYSKHNYVIIL